MNVGNLNSHSKKQLVIPLFITEKLTEVFLNPLFWLFFNHYPNRKKLTSSNSINLVAELYLYYSIKNINV